MKALFVPFALAKVLDRDQNALETSHGLIYAARHGISQNPIGQNGYCSVLYNYDYYELL